MTYAPAGTEIIFELLDDEVIIANLDVGIYYSIRESGVLIWQLLLSGHTPLAIESLFSKKYGLSCSIAPFIDSLLKENLLIAQKRPFQDSMPLSWPTQFLPPVLERYDEMKNLLMLDPIHEVDEQGWPHRK